jgi:hypothetical protein
MLKLIVSPEAASMIACRSEPGPLSFVFVTVIVNGELIQGLPTSAPAVIESPESVEPGEFTAFIGCVLMDVAHGIITTDATIAMRDISRISFSFLFWESWSRRGLG